MTEGDFALAAFRWFIPVAALGVAIVALYTVNRSPLIERMRDDNRDAKLLSRVQELEGDWQAFKKGVDAALGSVDQKIETVSDRLTSRQKRESYYASQAAGGRAAAQNQATITAAAEQGIDLSDLSTEPTLSELSPAVGVSIDRDELRRRMKRKAWSPGALGTAPPPPNNGSGVT